MRLLSWNCAQAAHAKLDAAAELRPDVAILAECARPDILRVKVGRLNATAIDWVGTNPQKGLAVLIFGQYSLNRSAD